MRSLFVIAILLAAAGVYSRPAFAQRGTAAQDTTVIQDSSGAQNLRPRWGSYIVGIFPTPAAAFQPITVQTYNHNAVELSVRVYDLAGRLMLELVPKQMLAGGLQHLTIPPLLLASGEYLVKLETYTASGAIDVVDEANFLIVH